MPVVARLEAMRATAGQAPIIVADPEAVAGPGLCCSCGDGLDVATSYGRCDACAVAVDLYYMTLHADDAWGEV